MKYYNIVFSNEPPQVRNCVWGKPVKDGFGLYWLEEGTWKPLKLIDNNGTVILSDDKAIPTEDIAEAISKALGSSTNTEDLSLFNLNSKINAIVDGISALIDKNTLDDSTVPNKAFDETGLTQYQFTRDEGLTPIIRPVNPSIP